MYMTKMCYSNHLDSDAVPNSFFLYFATICVNSASSLSSVLLGFVCNQKPHAWKQGYTPSCKVTFDVMRVIRDK